MWLCCGVHVAPTPPFGAAFAAFCCARAALSQRLYTLIPSPFLRTTTHAMSDNTGQQKERFAPKQPVDLAPPKDDVITRDYLSKCDGGAPSSTTTSLETHHSTHRH